MSTIYNTVIFMNWMFWNACIVAMGSPLDLRLRGHGGPRPKVHEIPGAHGGPLRTFCAFFVTLLMSTSLYAHDMYIWPRVDSKKPEEAILTMMLEKEEVVWFESMTAGLRLHGPSGEANLTIPAEGDPTIQFPTPGTYIIGWESEPAFIQIEPEIFQKYIRLEGYAEAADLRKKWNQEAEPGRELYTRYVKTYIQVGAQASEDFQRQFGYKLEIVPLHNPCALSVNSDLDVLVLYNGKPLTNHRIMATYDSYSAVPEEYAQVTVTDSDGIARFRISHKGLWLIRTNEMRSLDDGSAADWQSFWANVTFEVK